MVVEKIECTLKAQDEKGCATYESTTHGSEELVVQMVFNLAGCAVKAPDSIVVVVAYDDPY